jgi:predicted dehydrogenase
LSSVNLIHDIDLLRFLVGDIISVCSLPGPNTRGHPVEETGAVVLQFANGAVGTFVYSDAAASPFCWEGATGENPDLVGYYGKDVYTVLGTQGSIQLPSLELYSFAHLPETDRHWLSRLSVDKCYYEQAQSLLAEPPFTLQLRHLVRVMRRQEEPSCSAQEAYRSVQALEAVSMSYKSGQTIRL